MAVFVRTDGVNGQHQPVRREAEPAEVGSVRSRDFALRQCLLELRHAGGANLGAVNDQPSEPDQSFEVFQPGVADLGAAEAQLLELGQSFEVFQPGVADLGAVEDQPLSCVNPLRCSSPASLTLVPMRSSIGVASIL